MDSSIMGKEIGNVLVVQRRQQRVDLSVVDEFHGVVMAGDLFRAVKRDILQPNDADGFGVGVGEIFDGVGGDELSLLDNGRPAAVFFDFRQHMGGEKTGGAVCDIFPYQLEKFRLNEGVESRCGFVKEKQLRLVLHGADNAHLFAVAEGEFFHPLVCIDFQALAQLGGLRSAVESPHVGGESDNLRHFHRGVKLRFGGNVAHPLHDVAVIRENVHAEHLGAAPCGTD